MRTLMLSIAVCATLTVAPLHSLKLETVHRITQDSTQAEEKPHARDSTFRTTIYNKEYNIYITMDFYGKNITIPGQEVLGCVDGFIASDNCKHVWAITSSEITSGKTAHIEAINNYGSEDLTARLTLNGDGSYTLKHTGGSTLKFPIKGKWQKIPGTTVFTK